MEKIIIGKKYIELLEDLYKKFIENKDKYVIKEKNRFELYHRNCPFCLSPSISGFVEIEIEKEIYNVHLKCVEDGWISILERKLNQI
ncbi:MAG: hypothetical protein QXK80_01860 [Candidatus Pacearchaeota archaeon]